MDDFYKPAQVTELIAGRDAVRLENLQIQLQFRSPAFKTDGAKEHALHGFCRRISTLLRALELVFDGLPPDLNAIPERNTVVDAAIAIHSSVVNTFGALDNLAWILVFEKSIVGKNGAELKPMTVGLSNPYIRSACSQDFREYLDSMENWNLKLRKFRNSFGPSRSSLYPAIYDQPKKQGSIYET